MEKPILSISILISNNKENVEKCLKSIMPIKDKIPTEIILTDTGVSSDIRELIEKYGDKILDFEWCNDFSAARNLGLKEASGEWFLYVDDDEWFESTDQIVDFLLSEESKDYNVACYIQRNYLDLEGSAYVDSMVDRILRINDKLHFQRRIHEAYTDIDIKVRKKLADYVHHYGYAYKSEEEELKKHNRNEILLELEVKENSEDMRMWYQYMRNAYDYDWDKAIEIGFEAIEHESKSPYLDACYSGIIYCYYKKKDYENIKKYGQEFLEKDLYSYDMLGIVEYLTEAYIITGEYDKVCEIAYGALQLLKEYLQDPDGFDSNQTLSTTYITDIAIESLLAYIIGSSLVLGAEEIVEELSDPIFGYHISLAFDDEIIGGWLKETLAILNQDNFMRELILKIVPETIRNDFEWTFADKYQNDGSVGKGQNQDDFEAFVQKCQEIGPTDLKNIALDFPPEFFQGETRDDFYIEPLMKNAWAGEIEVLYKVDLLCQKYGIPYFINWGSLLGTIRHKGFIPWDDDIDIGVLRKDYEKLRFVILNCQNDLEFYDVFTESKWGEHASRITSSLNIITNRKDIKRYHGFIFPSGLDVFVVDCVPRDKRLEQEQYDAIGTIAWIKKLRKEMANTTSMIEIAGKQKQVKAKVEKLKELCNIEFEDENPSEQELLILQNEILSLYTEEDSDYYTVPHRLCKGQDYYIPKDVFSEMLRMPFENIMVNVPVGYDFILTKNYGKNYMTPVHRKCGHSYPFYGTFIESLRKQRKDESSEVTREYIESSALGYYNDFLHQTTEKLLHFDHETIKKYNLTPYQLTELEILEEIKRVCQKKNIKYFIIGDTLKEIVNNGQILNDDIIHLGMLRDDYIDFMNCLSTELGSWFDYKSIYLNDEHEDLRAYIVTDANFVDIEKYKERFYGCDEIAGIDISPIDKLDHNGERDQVRKNVINALMKTAISISANPPYSEEELEIARSWKEELEVSINLNNNLRREFLKAIDSVASAYKGKSDYLRVTPELQVGQDVIYKKVWFKDQTELHLYDTSVCVPSGYKEILVNEEA